MAISLLPKVGANDIDKIAVWDAQDVAAAGSKDASAIASDTGSLNGNWIRLRNFVNALRALIDGKQVALSSGTDIVVHDVTAHQLIVTTGGTHSTTLSAGPNAADRAVRFPDKDGTVQLVAAGYTLAGPGLFADVYGQLMANVDSDTVRLTSGVINAKQSLQIGFSFTGVNVNGGDGEFAVFDGRQTLATQGKPIPAGRIEKVQFALADGSVHDLTFTAPAKIVAAETTINFNQMSSMIAGFGGGSYVTYLVLGGAPQTDYIMTSSPAIYGTVIHAY